MLKKRMLISCMAVLILGTSCICSAKVRVVKVNDKKFNASMQIGDRIKIKLKKSDAKKLKWKSNNKSVATVNAKGCIKAKKHGKATITATRGKVVFKGKIKVVKKVKEDIVNNVETTVAPLMLQTESPVITCTVIPPTEKPTESPTVAPTESPTPEPTRKPVLCADTWLSFDIDQESITRETDIISGKVRYNWSFDTKIKIEVNNIVVSEMIIEKGKETFSIATDFSEYKVGDMVEISYTRATGNLLVYEEENRIVNDMVWPAGMSLTIADS